MSVLSEYDVKMAAVLEVCAKYKVHAVVNFLWSEGTEVRDRIPLTVGCPIWTANASTKTQVDTHGFTFYQKFKA